MFSFLKSFFPKPAPTQQKPQHFEVRVVAESPDECLRELERKTGLPDADLSLSVETREIGFWPSMRSAIERTVISKVSEEWRKNDTGYVAGSVSYIGKCDTPADVLSRVPAVTAAALLKENFYIGSIHVSKNCRGAFSKNVCTSCGFHSKE